LLIMKMKPCWSERSEHTLPHHIITVSILSKTSLLLIYVLLPCLKKLLILIYVTVLLPHLKDFIFIFIIDLYIAELCHLEAHDSAAKQ
jgi:hypothetical protein